MFLPSSGLSWCHLKMPGALLPQGPCTSWCPFVESSYRHSLPLQLQTSYLSCNPKHSLFFFPRFTSLHSTYTLWHIFRFTYVFIINFPSLNIRSVKCRDFSRFIHYSIPSIWSYAWHIVSVEQNLVKCVINKCELWIEKTRWHMCSLECNFHEGRS